MSTAVRGVPQNYRRVLTVIVALHCFLLFTVAPQLFGSEYGTITNYITIVNYQDSHRTRPPDQPVPAQTRRRFHEISRRRKRSRTPASQPVSAALAAAAALVQSNAVLQGPAEAGAVETLYTGGADWYWSIPGAKPPGWTEVLNKLAASLSRGEPWVVAEVKNGLGNRLRAIASAMAVASQERRPLLVVWEPDLHCNCSLLSMLKTPLPFALIEAPPPAGLKMSEFSLCDYQAASAAASSAVSGQKMGEERQLAALHEGAFGLPNVCRQKDAEVTLPAERHLWWRSAFLMNHPHGGWKEARRALRVLVPNAAVEAQLVASRQMVGVHVRNVFDAPRDATTAAQATGERAVEAAETQYGREAAAQLRAYRNASHWSQFVLRIEQLLAAAGTGADGVPTTRLYVAADSAEAYRGLVGRFGDAVVYTPRDCGDGGNSSAEGASGHGAGGQRCDWRDCGAMVASLVDMLNLARCQRILGSGWSSFTEVAAQWGGGGGGGEGGEEDDGVPLERAGIDFGVLIPREQSANGGGFGGGVRCHCNTPHLRQPGNNGYTCSNLVTKYCPLNRACMKQVHEFWPYGSPPCETGPMLSEAYKRARRALVLPSLGVSLHWREWTSSSKRSGSQPMAMLNRWFGA